MSEQVLVVLAALYALRAAYTAGVIKAWLSWEGKPYNAFSIAWAGLTWPAVLWRGWRTQRSAK